MLAWIEFSFRGWSVFTFWTVIISVILTLGFTVVVFIGGLGDLKYLLQAMGEESVDESDDGSVKETTEQPTKQ
jgi:hypothetical protein